SYAAPGAVLQSEGRAGAGRRFDRGDGVLRKTPRRAFMVNQVFTTRRRSSDTLLSICLERSFPITKPNLNALHRSSPRSERRVDVARPVRTRVAFMDDLLREFLTETSE